MVGKLGGYRDPATRVIRFVGNKRATEAYLAVQHTGKTEYAPADSSTGQNCTAVSAIVAIASRNLLRHGSTTNKN